MSLDQLRLLAGVVGGLALLLVAVSAGGAPVAGLLGRLAARAREDLSPVAAQPSNADRALDDMRFVLEMAHRLAADGRPEAVKLCQQLIDEMLRGKPASAETPKCSPSRLSSRRSSPWP